jgi:uncharacterized protein (TIGR04255 family)
MTLYDFISRDEITKVTLCSDFVALTTSSYDRWENFRAVGEKIIREFFRIYSPQIVTRIGLRYKDIIQKEKVNAKDMMWKELISDHISGILRNVTNLEMESEVISYTSSVNFKIPDGVAVLRHGLVRNRQTNVTGYLIDTDYFFDGKEEAREDAILARLDKFNSYSRRVFRWCITDALVERMDPQPVK